MTLENLIKLHLDPLNNSKDQQRLSMAAGLFCKEVTAFLDTSSGETFYEIPYDRITEIIFNHEAEFEKSTLNDYMGLVIEQIEKHLEKEGISEELKKSISSTMKDSEKTTDISIKVEEACKKHLIACYRKFVGHIGLAAVQKKFILKNLEQAKKVAEDAVIKAETAVLDVEKAAKLATNSSHDATLALKESLEIRGEVKKNEEASHNALEEAKAIKQDTNNLTIQFITILGIFATIIITVFGGISVVKAATGLLESGQTSIILVSFTVSILMCSLVCLVILLTSWINSVQDKNYEKLDYIRGAILTVFIAVTFFLGLYIMNNDDFDMASKDKTSFSEEYKMTIR